MTSFIVAAMKPDEAPISSRFTGSHPGLAATRETRADWGFCVSANRCYERDSTAPLRPAIDRGGFGICESLSQRGNYRETIRLARRNHKPGGADLAGSVHVVRSLSG